MSRVRSTNQTTPATPPSGTTEWFVDSADKKAKIIDDAGLVTDLTAGAGGGETNTASNVNVGGVGVFKQKTGVDLEFRGINAASSKITVVLDVGNNEIDVDVDPAQINAADINDDGTYLKNLVEDTTPQLGGDLDLNGSNITAGVQNPTITVTSGATQSVLLDNAGAGDLNLNASGRLIWGDGLAFDGILAHANTADRTYTFQDSDDTIVGRATTDTLTNKSIDAGVNTITGLTHGAEVDDPSSGVHGVAGSVVGTTDAQTLTSKTLTSPIVGTQITLDQTTADYTLTWADPAAARAISIVDPGGTDVFVWRDAAQTLLSKTFVAPVLGTPTSGNLSNCTSYPSSAIDHDATLNFLAAEHVDWAGASAGTIHPTNLPKTTKDMTIPNPTATDDFDVFYTEEAITVSEVRAYLPNGTATPSATYQLFHHTDRTSVSPNALTTSAAVTSVTGPVVATLSDATIPAGSVVWIEITAVSGTVPQFKLYLSFREDA